MDYGRITKETLRMLLEQVPPTRDNEEVRQQLLALITQETIDPKPYTYSAVYAATGAANSLAAGVVNSPYNINVQADADFLVIAQTYDANTANAARNAGTIVIPNVNVLLTDTGAGYQMMDQAVPVPNMFGTGAQPFILPQPWLWKAKSTIQVQATNYDAAAGYNLRLSFIGVKLFRFNG